MTTLTAEQFDRLPEEEIRRWELFDGELIEVPDATPRHNVIANRLSLRLTGFRVLPRTDFAVGPERRLRPDVAVMTSEAWKRMDLDQVPVIEMPVIVIEVVSPSDQVGDLRRKIRAYQDAGVAEVWIVYPESQEIEVYGAVSIQRYKGSKTLTSPLLPGWTLNIADLFLLS